MLIFDTLFNFMSHPEIYAFMKQFDTKTIVGFFVGIGFHFFLKSDKTMFCLALDGCLIFNELITRTKTMLINNKVNSRIYRENLIIILKSC